LTRPQVGEVEVAIRVPDGKAVLRGELDSQALRPNCKAIAASKPSECTECRLILVTLLDGDQRHPE